MNLLRDSTFALAARGVAAAISVLTAILANRILEPDDVGFLFGGMATVGVVALAVRFGREQALLRHLAANNNAEVWRATWNTIRNLGLAASVLAVALPVGELLLADIGGVGHLRWLPLLLVPVCHSILYTVGETKKYAGGMTAGVLLQSVPLPLFWLTEVVVASVVPASATYAAVVLIAATTAIVLLRVWRASTCGSSEPTRRQLKALGASNFALASITQFAIEVIPVYALIGLSTPVQAGYFGTAARLAMVPGFILNAVLSAVSPNLARLTAIERPKAPGLARHAAFISSLPAIAYIFALIGAANSDLTSYLRSGDLILYIALILATGHAFNALSGPVILLLGYAGHARALQVCVAAGATAVVAASVLGASRYGALGAAAGFAIGVALKDLAAAFVVRSAFGEWIYPWPQRSQPDRHEQA